MGTHSKSSMVTHTGQIRTTGIDSNVWHTKNHIIDQIRRPLALSPCPICFCEVTDPLATKCGHIFCHGCLKRSLFLRSACPSCNTELDNDNRFPLPLYAFEANLDSLSALKQAVRSNSTINTELADEIFSRLLKERNLWNSYTDSMDKPGAVLCYVVPNLQKTRVFKKCDEEQFRTLVKSIVSQMESMPWRWSKLWGWLNIVEQETGTITTFMRGLAIYHEAALYVANEANAVRDVKAETRAIYRSEAMLGVDAEFAKFLSRCHSSTRHKQKDVTLGYHVG